LSTQHDESVMARNAGHDYFTDEAGRRFIDKLICRR